MAGIRSSSAGIVGSYKAAMARQASYWTKAKASRESLGASMSQMRSTLASVSNTFANAAADRISGQANLAAQAGLDRINAMRKVKSEETLKQIDSAQKMVDQAKLEQEMKKKYYVYMLPEVPLVDTTA